ncbi:flagellin [Pseudotabrizicola algicola]|uniref:Flagellin n=1 Tax=Pseudotabrizicola algicola TaxID=2709381 RepID=A0A6B3RLW5_9RHOB|nr:flagellin [Pseudotabrizicola algicola]NEX45255.1 flagellar hook-associated protein 3 [Pseudotabrizicola algicola]
MTVGDALFARLAIRGFSHLSAEIGATQSRISAGTNDPRPSSDPARAMELSALRDLRARLDTRDGLAQRAADRLALTDEALAGLSDTMRQLKEITLRAANDTLPSDAFAALRAEAVTLRDSAFAIANATDSMGRPLFAGTGSAPAFEQTSGGIVYRGDDGTSVAQIGDRQRVATGLSGRQVFDEGPSGIFAALDDTIAALSEPMLSARAAVTATGEARMELVRSRSPQEIEITLTGPSGAARLTLDLRLDAPQAPVDAINAAFAATGVSAALDSDGKGIRLSATGAFTISDQSGGSAQRPVLTLGAVDSAGVPSGPFTGLRPEQMRINTLVGRAGSALDHLATMRATAGSLAEAVDKSAQAIASQRLSVNQAVAGLNDLDVAATVTRLQSLLMTEQAAQQAFVKISGQSLFNYLR